jgi:two-component sensor histidine kinase
MQEMDDLANNSKFQESVTAVHRDDCGLQAIESTARDLTAQNMVAESLQKEVAQLEDRVAERTRQLESAVMEVKRKNKEIANYSSAISNHRREKEAMMHEVNHRVMNNLQVIESMLKMKRRSLTDETAREAFENSIQRIHTMATAYGFLCVAPDLGCISLSAYLGELINEAMAAHGQKPDQVKFELDVEEIPLNLAEAVPFGQMMNELLSNCLEHGLPNDSAGKINVSVRRTANGVRMAIQDNGAGLPDGFDLSLSESMGLNLAAIWARQLGGTLAFTSSHGCRVQADFTRLGEQVKAERTGIARMMAMAMDSPSSLLH